MGANQILLFDLDDTIFETKSIDQKHVASIVEAFRESLLSHYTLQQVKEITSDLWKFPFDSISEKYKFNPSIQAHFSDLINDEDYNFEISPFSDFKIIESLDANKILVTTGFRKLQLAKIAALKLENIFSEIYIDEIDSLDRIYKKGIFKQLMSSTSSKKVDCFVIGDNPVSELKAGYELGLTTIQVAKFNQPKSRYADYYIDNYKDLIEILEANNK